MGFALDILPEADDAHVSSLASKVAPLRPSEDVDAVMRFLADAIELAKLPEPWVKTCGPDEQYFFTNRETGFLTWNHPLERSLCELALACRECLWLSMEERVAWISEMESRWEREAKAIIILWYRVEKRGSPVYFYNRKTGETRWEDPIKTLLPETFLKCRSIELLKNEEYVALLLGECDPPPGYSKPGETPWAQTLARRVLRIGCIELREEGAAEAAPDSTNPLRKWDLPLRLDVQKQGRAKAEKDCSGCQSVRSWPHSSQSTDIGSSDAGDFSDEEDCLDTPSSVTPMVWEGPLQVHSTDGESYDQSRQTPRYADFTDDDDASPASVASAASLHITIFDDDEPDDEAQDDSLDFSSIP